MFEAMKEFFDVASNRIKSPILGMIALVYLGLNWKPVYILLFSSESAEKRLEFFEQSVDWKTGIAIPLVLGFIFAILYPWLVFAGAWLVSVPIGRYRDFQDYERQSRKIAVLRNEIKLSKAKGELEATSEQLIIDRAARLEQVNKLVDPEIRSKAQSEIEESRNKSMEQESVSKFLESDLSSDSAKTYLLPSIAKNPAGSVSLHDLGSTFKVGIGTVQVELNSRRDFLSIQEAIANLERTERCLIKISENNWTLNREGYDLVEESRMLS